MERDVRSAKLSEKTLGRRVRFVKPRTGPPRRAVLLTALYNTGVNWNSFLYRRLARWITYQVRLWEGATLLLDSKYQAASFNDVFCDPFYWQVYNYIDPAPKWVVDCGANCGHFALLVEKCIRARHGSSSCRYLLIEPNPLLQDTIGRNLRSSRMAERCVVEQKLCGSSEKGSARLWVNPKNFLASSFEPAPGAKPYEVAYVDLNKIGDGGPIDLMKVDIEGGEFELVRSNRDALRRVKTLMLELHGSDVALHEELFSTLAEVGLRPVLPIRKDHSGFQLIVFRRTEQ
ncbi:hypothetical protein BH10PLA1_BH10PLA1_21000 [soil metagenome]